MIFPRRRARLRKPSLSIPPGLRLFDGWQPQLRQIANNRLSYRWKPRASIPRIYPRVCGMWEAERYPASGGWAWWPPEVRKLFHKPNCGPQSYPPVAEQSARPVQASLI